MQDSSLPNPATSRPALILASTSRYRRELLERLRIPFQTAVPAVDEIPLAGETPEATALRLAAAKARAVAAALPATTGRALVIGSDQVATFDGKQIGKPGTHERALAQLQSMRGREVLFHSALSLLDTATGQTDTVDIVTRVRFRDLPDAALDAYLRAEEPYDCAGSAKSEGLGIALLEAIESDDPTALIGLPLIALTRMLLAAGYPLLEAQ
ncbi:MAG: septum formation protein Maf [Paraburkholderia sp.]|uniref:Maf-like protein n=1 Tax=Paraburkholderia sp. TaxID=1926495 RepID=UPI0012116E40|nr:Maf-like protein [Paraburkholderia sp.]TAM04010.1 MAG: septum formation protein Maf [Paraburkholderia sp.]TAM27926.1 MAG: septum formation protein Maf [Paraburkholderia sp.]